jgi:hypothetical protein
LPTDHDNRSNDRSGLMPATSDSTSAIAAAQDIRFERPVWTAKQTD